MNPIPFYVTNDPNILYYNGNNVVEAQNNGEPPVPMYLVDPPNPPIPYSPPVGFQTPNGLGGTIQPPANFVAGNPAAPTNTVNVNGTAQPGITTQAIIVQIVQKPRDPPVRLNDIYGRVPQPFPGYQVPGPPITAANGGNLRKLKVYIVNKPNWDNPISTILGKDILINIIRSIQKLYINYLLLGSGQYKLYPVFSSYVDQLVEVRENNIARYLKNSMEDSEYRRLSSNAKVYELLLQIIDFTDPLFKKIIQTIISIPEKFVTKSIYNDFINSKEIGNYPDKFRKEILVTSQYYGQNDLFFYIYFTLKVLTVGNFTDRDDFISKSDQLIESVIMDFKKAESNLRQMRKRINRHETNPAPVMVRNPNTGQQENVRPRFQRRAGEDLPGDMNDPLNINNIPPTNEVENIDILATIMGYYEALIATTNNARFQTEGIEGNVPPVITWENFRNVRRRIRRFLKFCMNVKIIQYPYYIQPSTMKLYLCKVRDDFRRIYFQGQPSTEIEMLEPKSRYENTNLTKYAPEFKFNDEADVKYYCTYFTPVIVVNRENRRATYPPYWCLCRKINNNDDERDTANFSRKLVLFNDVYRYNGNNVQQQHLCAFQYYSGKYMNDESFGWTWVSLTDYEPVKKRDNNNNYYFLYREYKWGWYNDELGKFLTVPGDDTSYPITDYPPNEPFDAMKLVPPTDFSVIQMIFFIALLEMDVPQERSVNNFLNNDEVFPDDNPGFNFPKKLPADMNDTSNFLVKIFNICESISVSSNNLLKTKNNESLKALNYLQSLYPQWNLREPNMKLNKYPSYGLDKVIDNPRINPWINPWIKYFNLSIDNDESLFKTIIKSLDERVSAYGDFKSGMANFTLETIKNLCVQFSSGIYDVPLFYKLSAPNSQVKNKWNQINKKLLMYDPKNLQAINKQLDNTKKQTLKKQDIFYYIQKVQYFISDNFFKYLYALSSSTLESLKTENVQRASQQLSHIMDDMENIDYADIDDGIVQSEQINVPRARKAPVNLPRTRMAPANNDVPRAPANNVQPRANNVRRQQTTNDVQPPNVGQYRGGSLVNSLRTIRELKVRNNKPRPLSARTSRGQTNEPVLLRRPNSYDYAEETEEIEQTNPLQENVKRQRQRQKQRPDSAESSATNPNAYPQ